jgi:glycosyltransferase involved in cell wall biosynthesis
MNGHVRISVIIPAYNAAKYVGRAIESALAQTYPPLEVLVVDDGSTDDTARVVAQYPSPVRLLRQSNAGPGAARNHAAREAQGEWLALLDADDSWLPEKLERQIPNTRQSSVGMVAYYSDRKVCPRPMPSRIDFDVLWRCNNLTTSTALLRRAAFEAVGGFDEDRDLISVEDYNLWLRLAAAKWDIIPMRENLHCYTPQPGNLSSQTERVVRAEFANIESIAHLLSLDPALVQQKRIAISEEYGREFLFYRQPGQARRLLAAPLREQPSLVRLGWWMATFLPTTVLDLRRRLIASL